MMVTVWQPEKMHLVDLVTKIKLEHALTDQQTSVLMQIQHKPSDVLYPTVL